MHLKRTGCPKCGVVQQGVTKRSNCEEFVSKANVIHNNKYDYSKVNYITARINITIICPEHGEFKQAPDNHLQGKGCPICANKKRSEFRKFTAEQFINKARKVHSNKYNYSKVKYVNSQTKVTIICPEHGEFQQAPNPHLKGKGCQKCYGNMRKTTEQFIKEAKAIHDNKYDYSKVNYINTDTKIIIICPEHGKFEQVPNSHLISGGCPKCAGFGLTYAQLEIVKEIIKPLKLKNQVEYFKWWSDNIDYCRKMGIPRNPQQLYGK